MTNQIVELQTKTSPAQILKQVVPHVMKNGIDLFELVRISEHLKEVTNGSCDGRSIIHSLAALDIQLNLIGTRLMPHTYGDLPSIIIPAKFSDTTMQFHSYLEPVKRDNNLSLYFPVLDSESGVKEMLVKQGVWLKNYNGNYTYALLHKRRTDLQTLADDGDISGRTTMWVPVVRLDTPGPRKMTLLNCRASTFDNLESPFAKMFARTNTTLQVVANSTGSEESLKEARQAVTEAQSWFAAILEFFDSANNPIPANTARTVRELLIAAATTTPANVRFMLTMPNRSL